MENAQHDPHPLGSIWLCTRVTSDPTPSTSPQSKDEGKSFCRATHRECGRGPTTLCFDGSTSYGGFLGTDMEAEAMPRIAIAAAAAAIVDARHLEAILSKLDRSPQLATCGCLFVCSARQREFLR